ncbi:MAG: excinuclease ABC subunit UvrC [Candidatus Gastranaerophilales bacterium]|nr:excinuclease ABC subunit UvrC [Candidatus Gastranaerophilales bacterium]
MKDLTEQLKILPESPGSYQYFDKEGTVIYVGKAKNLKKRVASYFVNRKHTSEKLRVLVPKIVKIEFIITNSEIEALILESHLIKKYKPRYNVLLKDDKKFPYFVVTNEDYPRIVVARKGNRNPVKGKYFGPYTNSRAMYATLDLLKKLFPLKQCKTPKFRDRPCIYYNIGRCMAPCQKLISPEEYQKLIKNVELFLSGKQSELVEALKKQMDYFASREEFEKAARYRDSYFDVQRTIEKQRVVYENTSVNQDVIEISKESNICALSLVQIRDGRLIDKKDFELYVSDYDSDAELLMTFIKEYYELVSDFDIPNEIIIAPEFTPEDKELYESWLSSRRSGKKVRINFSKSKRNDDILELAKKNADYYLKKLQIDSLTKIQNDYNEVGAYVQEKLNLSVFPYKVECFDISHIQGTNTVASMVVFENGFPKKSEYKRFKIKSVDKPDDFQSMREVVSRRYGRLKAQSDKFPDLIIIDGGKGQLSSAKSILDELGCENQNIVSLAKRIEEVFIPNKTKPILFPLNSGALYFFQRIRDEAHRFAITYHRTLRGKAAVQSELDNIKGLFEKNKKLLIEKYKDVKAIKKLPVQELMLLLKKSQGQKVYDYFHKSKSD